MIMMLLREKRFSLVLGGSLLSKIGDGLHEFIFIITVLKVTNNRIVDAGLIYFFRFIPYLILGPIGGVLSDRLSRKYLMITADVARMLITGIFCAMLIFFKIDSLSLTLIGMVMTAFRTIFQPAFQAALPTLVAEENLPSANGATQISSEVGAMIGPAIGGVALAMLAGPGQALLLDVVTYFISALCLCFVPISSEYMQSIADRSLNIRTLYGDFGQNFKDIMNKKSLFITIIYSSVCILFVGGALRILIPALMKGNHFSDSQIGYAISLIALGTICGAVLCGKITQTFSTNILMRYWCIYGLILALLPIFVSNSTVFLIICFSLGLIGAFVDVVLSTNIQQLSTNQNIGKNFGLFSTLANTGEALSGGFAGLLVLVSSVGASVAAIGLLIASVALAGKYKSVMRHDR